MIKDRDISFKVKREHQKAILDTSSNNPMKVLLYRGLNAFIGLKTNLENALGPDIKELIDKLILNLCLFDGPKLIFKIKQKNKEIIQRDRIEYKLFF